MVLAGDADRERAAASLREHFVSGRLTLEELAERTEFALRARSTRELRRALDGLPYGTLHGILRSVGRGVALVVFTGAWLLFSFVLLLLFGLMLLIHGTSAVELAAFLLAWAIPTFFVARLWRRGLTRRPRRAVRG